MIITLILFGYIFCGMFAIPILGIEKLQALDKDGTLPIPVFVIWWPATLAIVILYKIYDAMKQKPREQIPWTCGGYLWGELVLVDWDKKGIVVWQYWYDCLFIIYINSKAVDSVDISRVTSTTKPSELVEELAMFDQANKLLSKADAIVKEAGELKMKAVKKRTNLIYSPK